MNDKQFTVTVTTGLLQTLDPRETEAVLAHELTHIRNGDARMMVIAVLIAGVVSLVGELVFRGFFSGGSRSSSSSDDRKSSGFAIFVGFAIVAVSWALAVVIRLSLSRTREYLADAGAVELTKNPDALISALQPSVAVSDTPISTKCRNGAKTATVDPKDARLLLVEDNEINQQVAIELLRAAGYRC